jgi:hypothetical protein
MILFTNYLADAIAHFVVLSLIAVFLRVALLNRSMAYLWAAAAGAVIITTVNHTFLPNFRVYASA